MGNTTGKSEKKVIYEADAVKKVVSRLTVVTVAGNVVLSLFKFVAGIVANSSAMVSDAVHSLSDIFTTIVAVIGVRLSQKDADEEHQFGHERFECVAGLILSAILMSVGCGIGYAGVVSIVTGSYEEAGIPGMLALIAAVTSIAVKEAMFWYTRHYAIMINSTAFMADAWHHRADAISSIGALIGIAFSRMGYPVMDSVASVIIAAFIFKTSIDIIKETIGKMTDKACDEETQKRIREYITGYDQVRGIDLLRTRMFGSRIYVEAEIELDGDMMLRDAHKIAEDIHEGLEKELKDVKHIMIHINPA